MKIPLWPNWIRLLTFNEKITGSSPVKGIKYSSNFEKECFEFLIENNIEFTPHKNIPNSSKISDIYFKNIDLYIELDGINREKKNKWLKDEYKYWLDKLEIYKKQKLNYKILYNFKEFKNFILTEFK